MAVLLNGKTRTNFNIRMSETREELERPMSDWRIQWWHSIENLNVIRSWPHDFGEYLLKHYLSASKYTFQMKNVAFVGPVVGDTWWENSLKCICLEVYWWFGAIRWWWMKKPFRWYLAAWTIFATLWFVFRNKSLITVRQSFRFLFIPNVTLT